MPTFTNAMDAVGWCGYTLKEVDRLMQIGKDFEAEKMLAEVENVQEWISTQPVPESFKPKSLGFRPVRYELD